MKRLLKVFKLFGVPCVDEHFFIFFIIGTKGFLMDCGINEEVFAATTSTVLSGFLWNVDLMFPMICGLGT